MPRNLLATLSLLVAVSAFAQQPALTADAIMARVAANQDKSETARAHYLYTQHAHIASRKGKTVHCEETTDIRITPTPAGSDQQLLKLDGRLLQKGKYITYTQLPAPEKPRPRPADTKVADSKPADVRPADTKAPDATPTDPSPKAAAPPGQPTSAPSKTDDDDDVNINLGDDTMDRDLVENLRHNLTATHSKDGISANLFPLTSKEQALYNFTLLGRELRNRRDSFHISFSPKDHEDFTWKGDAWIDATAFQPIVVRTTMSRKIPLAVRMLLGTNVPGLGFTIVYAPQPVVPAAGQPSDPEAALWFPTSFGTEFKIHVLFFFSREIVFNAENRDFQQTHTTHEIHDAPTPSD